jgi:hypothetical protein
MSHFILSKVQLVLLVLTDEIEEKESIIVDSLKPELVVVGGVLQVASAGIHRLCGGNRLDILHTTIMQRRNASKVLYLLELGVWGCLDVVDKGLQRRGCAGAQCAVSEVLCTLQVGVSANEAGHLVPADRLHNAPVNTPMYILGAGELDFGNLAIQNTLDGLSSGSDSLE